jgi:FixJ family two-component response regulator
MSDLRARLTTRQREIVILLHMGKGYREVAGALGITRRTVRIHVQTIARRLDGDDPPLRRVLRHAERLLNLELNPRDWAPPGDGLAAYHNALRGLVEN